MSRRAFVTGLGAVIAAPRAVQASQAGKVARIGLVSTNVVGNRHVLIRFRVGLLPAFPGRAAMSPACRPYLPRSSSGNLSNC